MKLKTSLTASRDGSIVDATDENLIHDTAAAHAFWIAIHEQSPRMRIKLHERALTIMRSWGFDTVDLALMGVE